MTVLLDASDRVSLATCTLDHDALVDDLTHERYRLSPTAAALLAGCDGRHDVGELTAEHGRAYGVEPSLLHEHLSEFVALLGRVGLVRVRRRWRHRLLGALLELRPGDVDPSSVVRRRYPATPWGCARAALHASRIVGWFGVLLTALLGTMVARFAPGVALGVALVPAVTGLAGLASIAGHEVGHLFAVRWVGGRACYAAAGPSQVAVVHDVDEPGSLRRVAVAGPLAGAATALVAWPALAMLPAPAEALAVPTAILLAACHLAGLLPWLPDGRHLRVATQ